MYYKTLQLIQNLGKASQTGRQLSWLSKPTTVALPFNVACVRLFAAMEPGDRVPQEMLDQLRTELITHKDERTARQLGTLEWACQLEGMDDKIAPESLFTMAKILLDLYPESFEELYYTVPETERKKSFINRYMKMWQGDPNYGQEKFCQKLIAFSQGAIAKERKIHPKLFDLLKVITLKENTTTYPDYNVGKVVFKGKEDELVTEEGRVAEKFQEGLRKLIDKAGDKISPMVFRLFEKYFSFEGILGLDTTLFYAVVRNKYGAELPSEAIFGFEYDQITLDIDQGDDDVYGIKVDVQKRLTEVFVDDASQKVIAIDPPLLVHSLLYVTEKNGIVEAKLENLTTVNYSKFVASLSTEILKSTKAKE